MFRYRLERRQAKTDVPVGRVMDEIQEEISDAFDDAFPACDGE